MNKHLLIVGDLGAGSNLVKNLCLLDRSFDCPWDDRFDKFNQLYDKSQLSNWVDREVMTRFWKFRYGFDLSDDLGNHDLTAVSRTVFINHSAFWESDKLQKFQESCDIVIVAPLTDLGLRWQIRAYAEKKNIDKLHNFSFENPDIERPEYINQHGLSEYIKFNVLNMYEIIRRRRDEILANTDFKVFDMSPVFAGENLITEFFNNTLDLKIPEDQADILFSKWYSLHWDYADTDNWEWGGRYNGYNS